MVFRVVGVWPLIHESEAREQIHAWLVAWIHLSQHERRAIGTPRIITKPHNHRGEQRVSEMLPPYLQRGGDVRNLVDAFVLLGGFHADTVFAEADHFIMQGNVPGYDKKRAHNSGRGLAHAETAYISLWIHRPFGVSWLAAQELSEGCLMVSEAFTLDDEIQIHRRCLPGCLPCVTDSGERCWSASSISRPLRCAACRPQAARMPESVSHRCLIVAVFRRFVMCGQ